MYKNDSIERIFRLGGEDLVDWDREGYVEDDDEEYDGLEQKDLTKRFEIFANILQFNCGTFWYRQHFEGHVIGGSTIKGHTKRCHQMDRRMLDLSENQVARGSNLAGQNIA